ncbi:hypothetical protein C8J56DRAFT_1061131 [Mycena floridula]|nr:hypothetical protein C8J56DRAFT_1061131 [Mycena floridula]
MSKAISSFIRDEGYYVINWEMAKDLGNPNRKSPSSRYCTIRFMSSRLLDNLNKRPELQDDLEAFVHVMLYISFRYLKTNSTQNQLLYFLDRV